MQDFATSPPTLTPGKSLLVETMSDWRALMPGPATGMLQLMYPPLGHGVSEHSEFFTDPFGRILRSIPQIWAVVLSPDGPQRGLQIRDLHHAIKGTMPTGERYHSLDPETFWWAHATFTWEMFRARELYWRRPLTEADKDRLYAETVLWYERYGVSMRPVPADRAGFEAKFRATCDEVLELTPAAAQAVEVARSGGGGVLPLLPGPVQRALRPFAAPLGPAAAYGTMPRPVIDRLGLPWRRRDDRAFAVGTAVVRSTFSCVPRPVNERTMRRSLRMLGSATKGQRYVAPPRAAAPSRVGSK